MTCDAFNTLIPHSQYLQHINELDPGINQFDQIDFPEVYKCNFVKLVSFIKKIPKLNASIDTKFPKIIVNKQSVDLLIKFVFIGYYLNISQEILNTLNKMIRYHLKSNVRHLSVQNLPPDMKDELLKNMSLNVALKYRISDKGLKAVFNIEDFSIEEESSMGHLESVQHLHSIGLKCSTDAMDNAAAYGHLDVIVYLYSIGKRCSSSEIALASAGGNLEVVKFLYSIGAKNPSGRAMDMASMNGHLEVVKYLHSMKSNCCR